MDMTVYSAEVVEEVVRGWGPKKMKVGCGAF